MSNLGKYYKMLCRRNKAKGLISKRVFQENKAHQIFRNPFLFRSTQQEVLYKKVLRKNLRNL